jgi:hypothetical protein
MKTTVLEERKLWCSNPTPPSARVFFLKALAAIQSRLGKWESLGLTGFQKKCIEGKAGVYFAYINDNTGTQKVLKFIVANNE